MPIKCENLTKKYDGKLVLDRWTATISDTGVTAIMGPSGIGKTTLFRLLAGLEKADDGRITGLSGKKLSVVFQEDRLFPQLTVLKNLQVAGDGAEKWLSRLGLSEAAQQYPEELSIMYICFFIVKISPHTLISSESASAFSEPLLTVLPLSVTLP